MRTTNNASETLRYSESGLVWEELISNNSGTLELRPMMTFRVRADAGGVTVTIDGVLAMTMANGEIAIFCTGNGDPDDDKPTVTVVISGNSYVQVARDKDREKLLP